MLSRETGRHAKDYIKVGIDADLHQKYIEVKDLYETAKLCSDGTFIYCDRSMFLQIKSASYIARKCNFNKI